RGGVHVADAVETARRRRHAGRRLPLARVLPTAERALRTPRREETRDCPAAEAEGITLRRAGGRPLVPDLPSPPRDPPPHPPPNPRAAPTAPPNLPRPRPRYTALAGHRAGPLSPATGTRRPSPPPTATSVPPAAAPRPRHPRPQRTAAGRSPIAAPRTGPGTT